MLTPADIEMQCQFDMIYFCLFVDYMIKLGKFQPWTIGLLHSTAPCPILKIQSTRLGSDKYKIFMSLGRLDQGPSLNPWVRIPDLRKWERDTHLIRHPFWSRLICRQWLYLTGRLFVGTLCASNIYDRIRMSIDLLQYTLPAILLCCPTQRPGC